MQPKSFRDYPKYYRRLIACTFGRRCVICESEKYIALFDIVGTGRPYHAGWLCCNHCESIHAQIAKNKILSKIQKRRDILSRIPKKQVPTKESKEWGI